MGLYFRELVKLLDQEEKQWRESTIFMHDGAAYAKSGFVKNILKELRVPFMLTAPHSYNVSPIELLFGAIKNSDINPQGLGTGKA